MRRTLHPVARRSIRRRGFATLALMAIGLPTILLLGAVMLDESRNRAAYSQATEALLVAYREAGKAYGASLVGWTSVYPPASNLLCNFTYPASEEASDCEIEAAETKLMGSGAAVTYANAACGVAIDYLKEKGGVFGFVSQYSDDVRKGIRAQFGIFSIVSGEEAEPVGVSTDSCERVDIEEYTLALEGPKVADVMGDFANSVGEKALSVPVFGAGTQITSYPTKWFVGVIGIKVRRLLPFRVGEEKYIYTKFIAPLQTVLGLDS